MTDISHIRTPVPDFGLVRFGEIRGEAVYDILIWLRGCPVEHFSSR
jgi:hypothetical protein